MNSRCQFCRRYLKIKPTYVCSAKINPISQAYIEDEIKQWSVSGYRYDVVRRKKKKKKRKKLLQVGNRSDYIAHHSMELNWYLLSRNAHLKIILQRWRPRIINRKIKVDFKKKIRKNRIIIIDISETEDTYL